MRRYASTGRESRLWGVFRSHLTPALAGIGERDLASWRGDGPPGLAMAAPDGGNFRPLVAAGGGSRAWYLLETYPGEGRIVICHLPVVAGFDAEPAARMLVESLLRYALSEAPLFHAAAGWAPPESGLWSLLRRAGAAVLPQRTQAEPASDLRGPAHTFRARSPRAVDSQRRVSHSRREHRRPRPLLSYSSSSSPPKPKKRLQNPFACSGGSPFPRRASAPRSSISRL